MAHVKYQSVWKLFGSVPVVKDLSLEIEQGEFLVLVGPSGCGKTTTLRMLAGLELPSYGRIWIDDQDATLLPPGRRDVSMVFQSYALFPHMTVFKNLAFGPSVRHQGRAERESLVIGVAKSLGLESFLDRRPDQLSGGQRQRVALGRALVRQPRVFLLDEPLSNLDAALRVQMRSELIRLHHEWQVTTIYVTHDQVEALTMGDRVAVFDQGNLLQVGTPSELYDAPRNRFVAEFIGSPKMNLLPGEVMDLRSGRFDVQFLGETISVGEEASRGHVIHKGPVLVGVRPHDLHLAEEAPARCTARVTAIVELVEHAGSEIFLEVQTSTGAKVIARTHRSTRVSPGERVLLAFDPAALHLFAMDTGEALLDRGVEPRQPTARSEMNDSRVTKENGRVTKEISGDHLKEKSTAKGAG